MRLSRVRISLHGGPSGGARAGGRAVHERRGLLLTVRTPDGVTAQGEASPLPGYSTDTLETARAELEALDFTRLPEPEPGMAATELLARARAVTPGLASPSARHALEAALLQVLAVRSSVPLWQLVAPATPRALERRALPLSLFIGSAGDPGLVARAASAAARGAASVKVKLGREALADLGELRAVRRALGTTRLRLDANRSLAPETAGHDLAALAELEPEWVEEPVPTEALIRLGGSPVPLALDESLQHPELWEALRPRLPSLRAVALVLKPMALGGVSACLDWAGRAATTGMDVSLSHLFDGPIALAVAAHLAVALGSPLCGQGIPRHAGLAAWPELSLPFLGDTELAVPREPGLGVAALPEAP